MVNDPIADLLVRLQNASRVGHESVSMPYSKIKAAIAGVLEREGYIGGSEHKNNSLVLSLKYSGERPAIAGFKRVSKLSRRSYLGTRELRPIKRGHGLLVLSTPQGVMSGKDARG